MSQTAAEVDKGIKAITVDCYGDDAACWRGPPRPIEAIPKSASDVVSTSTTAGVTVPAKRFLDELCPETDLA